MDKWLKLKIAKEDRGMAAVEFAIILPVLLLTLIGLFDIANFAYCHNKMNRTAQEINNIVTRGNVTKPQLDGLLRAAALIAQPFNFTTSGNVIVTSVAVVNANQGAQIMWRDSYPGGVGGSLINPASLPGGLVLNTNQTAIFTEVFFTYTPLITSYILSSSQTKIYALAAGMPRQGQMTTLPSS